jgi:hypothetical protein
MTAGRLQPAHQQTALGEECGDLGDIDKRRGRLLQVGAPYTTPGNADWTATAQPGGGTRLPAELLAALVGGQKRVYVIGLRLRRRHSHLCDGGAKHVCHELIEVLLRVKDIDTVESIVSNPRPMEQAALTWMRPARNGV